MTRLRAFFSRIAGLVRGRHLDRDLQDQIDAHLDEATHEYIEQGLSREEARRAALRSFGGVAQAQERHRELRTFAWLGDAQRDVRYAIRALRRTPGFTAVAVVTLTLAVGVATAIFSVIDAALLRPVPYEKPQEIVALDLANAVNRGISPSAVDVERWRQESAVLAHIGMGRMSGFTPVIVDAGIPERLTVGSASEGFLEVFGVTPVIGRAIAAEDRRPGSPLVVLLGHEYWRTRFGGTPDALGRSIRLDGAYATVIGVVPAGFYSETMVWRPHAVLPAMVGRRGTGVPVYARLRSGVGLDTAVRDLTAHLSVDAKSAVEVQPTPLYEETTRGYGRTVAVLAGAVALILLIACVNVAGLLLARGANRQIELAIRKSIGASRGRIIRQLLAESAVLALVSAAAGVLLALMTLDAIVALTPLRLPDNVTPAINPLVQTFALGLSIVTSIAFGLAPALKLSRTDIDATLAAGRMRHASALTRRGRQVLVAVEVALALVLLTGAALMIRSLSKIQSIDVGFQPRAMVTMEVLPVDNDPVAQEAYFLALLRKVRQIPGVAAAGVADRAPLDGSGSYTSVTVNERSTSIAMRHVMPGYFEAIGLALRQGRYPTDADYRSTPFVVLSEAAARAIYPDQPAVGQQVILDKKAWQVIGVVRDARNRTPLPQAIERPDVYLAYLPDGSSEPFGAARTIVVRPARPIPKLAEQLRDAAYAVGPRVIVERVRSGQDWFAERVATERQRTTLLSLLGGLGLLLAIVGIFGTTAYAVARRVQEVGIRMALGARPGRMVGAIVRDTAWPVMCGIAIGLPAAAAASRVIASFLFQTEPTDLLSFAVTVVLLGTTALVAAWIPARRAAHVDPVKALRAE